MAELMIMSDYSAGGSKGPARPLGGVRGVPAFPFHLAAGGGKRKKTCIVMIMITRKPIIYCFEQVEV
jgi:hypothetical protein